MIQSVDDLLSQLRPITGPEAVPPVDETNWWLVAAIVGAVMVALILAVRWWRRAKPPISPIDEALFGLSRLPTEPSPASMATLDQLSRRWLSRIHNVDGEHETGRAMLSQLPQSVHEVWSAIFAQLEPGRFSQHPLTATQWNDVINAVRKQIQSGPVNIAGSVAG